MQKLNNFFTINNTYNCHFEKVLSNLECKSHLTLIIMKLTCSIQL